MRRGRRIYMQFAFGLQAQLSASSIDVVSLFPAQRGRYTCTP
jgi:hypothetical protein